MDDSPQTLLTIKEASFWASDFLKKKVTGSNISYLIQYGKVKKIWDSGTTLVDLNELKKYYQSFFGERQLSWKNKLGDDLNWHLSFEDVKEVETTKHVHRLHPYKGKFIPQLVEYFLDNHTDEFKKQPYFKKGDIVLDPFCGSGTTLVQANELGIHAVGIDVSSFNSLISNVKIGTYNFSELASEIQKITQGLSQFSSNSQIIKFDQKLTAELAAFNNKYFPVPDYKYKIYRGEIDEGGYSQKYEKQFLPIYNQLVKEFNVEFKQDKTDSFIDKWYIKDIRREMDFVFNLIKQVKDIEIKKVLCVILSRTIRSCRATTHSDLATLVEPVTTTYYCSKHGKICKPLFTILSWWKRYSLDTLSRLKEFSILRTNTYQYCLTNDSRIVDVVEELKKRDVNLAELVQKNKFKGIFSSPPYVGLIDYHNQHSYAYDLFGFVRNDESEIGPLLKGQGFEARRLYVQGITNVLNNCRRFLVNDAEIFLVANDKYNLYPTIAEKSGLMIVNQFKRPVLNRTEKDKGAYSEIIFHLKTKNQEAKNVS